MKIKILAGCLICFFLISCASGPKQMYQAEFSTGNLVVPAKYVGGLTTLDKKTDGTLYISNSSTKFTSIKGVHFNLPTITISGVYVGKEVKLKFGNTLARWLLIGPFALFIKDKSEAMAIEFTDREQNSVVSPIFQIKVGSGAALKQNILAKQKIAAGIKIDWDTAQTANTFSAYEEFRKRYPGSEYAEEARLRRNALAKESPKTEVLKDVAPVTKQKPPTPTKALKKAVPVTKQKPPTPVKALKKAAPIPKPKPPKPVPKMETAQKIEKLSPEHIEAFRSAKTMRLSVKQQYRTPSNKEIRDVKLPFKDVAEGVFNIVGVQAVGSDAWEYDLEVKIEATGRALGTSYSPGGWLYSGAYLKGTISIEIPGRYVYTKSFEGQRDPPHEIASMLFIEFRTASGAPFIDVFFDSFYMISDMVYEIYGIDPLILALKNSVKGIRIGAAQTLGEIKDSRAVEHLVSAMEDSDWMVRAHAALALDSLGWTPENTYQIVIFSIAKGNLNPVIKIGKQAIEPLKTLLKDRNSYARNPAARALEKLGWTPEDDNQKVYFYIAKRKWKLVEEIGEPAVEPLLDLLSDRWAYYREKAAKGLGELNDKRAVEPLIDALFDRFYDVRRKAAKALWQLKDNRAVEYLIIALEDSDTLVRINAAAALGEIKDVQAIEPLIAGLHRMSGYDAVAVESLTKITGEKLGKKQDKWQAWWRQNKEKYLKKK